MSDPFKPVDRDTPYLLPPSLQDWLPQEHLARFVVEIVDSGQRGVDLDWNAARFE